MTLFPPQEFLKIFIKKFARCINGAGMAKIRIENLAKEYTSYVE
jgi:hypothetical protein